MSVLRIDFEQTMDVGSKVIEKAGDFQDLLNKIKGINSELKNYWKGSDASTYSTAVEQQAEYMQQLSDTINEIGVFLEKVGKAYQDARDANASAING